MISRGRSRAFGAAVSFVALAAGVVASVSGSFHSLAWLAPDSASYLNAEISRTPAYPLILHTVPLSWLPAVQLIALCASGAYLAWELAALLPALFALGYEVMVLGNAQLMSYAFTVLPEALFVSAEQIQMAVALRLLRAGRRVDGLMLGLTTAVMILLKPSGYSFVVPIAVVAWLRWGRVRATLVPAAAAVVGALLLASTANLVRAGVFATQAFGGYVVGGYVGHLIDANASTRYPELARTIADRTAVSRAELDATTDIDAYYLVSSNAYHDVLEALRPAILDFIHRENPDIGERATFVRMNEIAQSLSIAAITRHPIGYLRQVSGHLYGLWSLPSLRNRDHAAALADELSRMHTTAPFTMRHEVVFRSVSPLVFWPIKILLAIAFLASCAGIVLAIGRTQSDLLLALAYCAIALHANFLLVAAVGSGLPRYALAMWPATIATATIGVWAGIEALWMRTPGGNRN